MPRLPGVNHRDAVRALGKAGFTVVREGRKHIVMADGARFLTVPRNNPVNAFTMGGIVRDAGLSIEESCIARHVEGGQHACMFSPAIAVTNISMHGIPLLTAAGETFLSFGQFPRFRDASLARMLPAAASHRVRGRGPALSNRPGV